MQLLRRVIFGLLLLGSTTSWSAAEHATPASASESEAIAALKSELKTRAAQERFSGVVLIARDGKPIFQAAYGYANREKGIPNTVHTKFRFGSMGKMFTGVAVLQLVQAGTVRLDDPLSNYLPDYPNRDVAQVTIHQLLTHTGGTGDIFGPEFAAHRLELKELTDYVALYGSRGLRFPPGSRYEYSNYGFVLLGRVIEVVSGQSYDAYVRDYIFKPARMKSTDNLPEERHVRNLSIPYTTGGGPGPQFSEAPAGAPLRSAEEFLPYRGTSAGGGYSTIRDFMSFVSALTSYQLLRAHYTDLAFTGKVETPRPGTQYAYGFEDSRTPDGIRFFGHGGGAPGINGSLSVYPTSGYVVVVLANFDPPAAMEIDQFIGARLAVR